MRNPNFKAQSSNEIQMTKSKLGYLIFDIHLTFVRLRRIGI